MLNMLLGRILLPNCKSSKLIMVTQMVPNTRENKELYAWVANQRRYMYYKEYQGGKPSHLPCTNERIEQLDAIGFEWRSTKMYKWKIRFGELRDFYDEYGIAPVPSKEVALYQWARRQKMNTIRMSTRRQQIRTRRD